MASFNIFSINVRSIGERMRRARVLTFLSLQKCDVYMLQECALPFSRSYRHLSGQWSHGPSYWSGGERVQERGCSHFDPGGMFHC
ncbi:hypothetical protein FKM82_030833 [Ascaphus truei]